MELVEKMTVFVIPPIPAVAVEGIKTVVLESIHTTPNELEEMADP